MRKFVVVLLVGFATALAAAPALADPPADAARGQLVGIARRYTLRGMTLRAQVMRNAQTPDGTWTSKLQEQWTFFSPGVITGGSWFWLLRSGPKSKPSYMITPVGDPWGPRQLTVSGDLSLTGSYAEGGSGTTPWSTLLNAAGDSRATATVILSNNHLSLAVEADNPGGFDISDSEGFVSNLTDWSVPWTGAGHSPHDGLSPEDNAHAELPSNLGKLGANSTPAPRRIPFGQPFVTKTYDNAAGDLHLEQPFLYDFTQNWGTQEWSYTWTLSFKPVS
jgi:hypothetical protein